jgi:hypothetical protein
MAHDGGWRWQDDPTYRDFVEGPRKERWRPWTVDTISTEARNWWARYCELKAQREARERAQRANQPSLSARQRRGFTPRGGRR